MATAAGSLDEGLAAEAGSVEECLATGAGSCVLLLDKRPDFSLIELRHVRVYTNYVLSCCSKNINFLAM